MRTFFILIAIAIWMNLNAQNDSTIHKQFPAVRATKRIVIDGELNDEDWKNAPAATNFVQRQPTYKKPERFENRTEVKILYDDDAIYIAGYCHESNKDSISSELVGRDMIGANDFLGVIFDTYNDRINGFGYYVTPLGEQYDAKYSSTGEDGSWNSVYRSAAKIVGDGWTFEMKIPYSAIRFCNKKVQTWGMNFFRKRKKAGENLTWNPIDQTKSSFFAQFGLWTNISDIKLPIRLSFSPYFSTDVSHYPYNDPNIPNTSTKYNGGMDVKYGINQAFTMDMTLVPDFGQVQSDNKVLNLTPFEVKYNEYRSFFTEGTELFSKGGIFYSRRIGGTPIHIYDVGDNLKTGDSIIFNPAESRIINATKISGRTASGLGIGVLNAVTEAQYATIQDVNKHQYQVQTNPLTNYNILVFDQSLKHNSSVSLINTNVSRNSRDQNTNVTAALWDIYDKSEKWNFSGKAATSQQFADETHGGHVGGVAYTVNAGKAGGKFNFTLTRDFADDKYSHQDMGYFTNNNFVDHSLWMGYRILKPHSFYNSMYMNMNLYYSQHYEPREYQQFSMFSNINGQLKNLGSYYVQLNIDAAQNDYYEPRDSGFIFKRPSSWILGVYITSNDAKKFSTSWGLFHRFYHTDHSTADEIDLGAQYRFSKAFSINLSSTININNNNLGFSHIHYYKMNNINKDSVFFALRKVRIVENVLTAKYNFSNTMGLSLRIRHYWTNLKKESYKSLNMNGDLTDLNGVNPNVQYNVNYFNIDAVYNWQFNPGSFFTITWKNAINPTDDWATNSYTDNLRNTLFKSDKLNTLSFKIIYFLDYLDIKHHNKRLKNS